MSERYSLDRVGDAEWVMFDRERRGTPHTYLLFLVPLVKGPYNYQLVLTAYDAASASKTAFPIFTEELFSTFFYSVPEGVEDFVYCTHQALQDLEIDDPIDLPHFLGGTVRSRAIMTPVVLNSN
jgi:hypothetical protein